MATRIKNDAHWNQVMGITKKKSPKNVMQPKPSPYGKGIHKTEQPKPPKTDMLKAGMKIGRKR
jgi:hypothetical protein